MTLTERLFSGQVLDPSTGLYYYGNGRYYDPSIGRYISPDPYLDAPFSSQRLDRYNFGFNNPLRYKRSEACRNRCGAPTTISRSSAVASALGPDHCSLLPGSNGPVEVVMISGLTCALAFSKQGLYDNSCPNATR
jgi:RHS repeat-associated protein